MSEPMGGLGIAVRTPPGWSPVDASAHVVPGVPMRGWRGPDGATLVVYRALWIPDPDAAKLAEETVLRWENLPGMTVRSRGTVRLKDGSAASWIEVTASGDGGSLAPTGMGEPAATHGRALMPTRRIAVAVPRRDATWWIEAHAPESSAAALRSAVEAVLGGPTQTKAG